jgi:hypothetical protein
VGMDATPKKTERYQELRSKRDQEGSQPPETLYKYTCARTAIKILEGRSLRWACPLNFNDPLDLQWDLLWNITTPEFRLRLLDQMSKSPHQRLDDVDAMLEGFRRLPGKSIHDLACRFRVVCLSERVESAPMWAHYGDQHQGVALEFDSRVLEDDWRDLARRVSYATKPPVCVCNDEAIRHIIARSTPVFPSDVGLKLCLTKAKEWEYEREWRFATVCQAPRAGEFDDRPFPDGALRSVTFGIKVGLRCQERLLEMLRLWGSDISVQRIVCDSARMRLLVKKEPGEGVPGIVGS